MSQKITLDAQQQAILITRFDNGCDKLITYMNKLIKILDGLDAYESRHKAQLMDKLDEVKAATKKVVGTLDDGKRVVESKRQYLIENEGKNIFANIEVEKPKTTVK